MTSVHPISTVLFGVWCSFCTITGCAVLASSRMQAFREHPVLLPMGPDFHVLCALVFGGLIGMGVGLLTGATALLALRRTTA